MRTSAGIIGLGISPVGEYQVTRTSRPERTPKEKWGRSNTISLGTFRNGAVRLPGRFWEASTLRPEVVGARRCRNFVSIRVQEFGDGKSTEEALRLLRKAADQGFRRAAEVWRSYTQ